MEAPSGFEPEMEVLQTSALPLGDGAVRLVSAGSSHPRLALGCEERRLERETGFEPATSTLARSHSTTELFPLATKSDRTTAKLSQSRRPSRRLGCIIRHRACHASARSRCSIVLALFSASPARADEVAAQERRPPHGHRGVPGRRHPHLHHALRQRPDPVGGGRPRDDPRIRCSRPWPTHSTRPQPPVIVDGGANAGIITTAGNTDVNNLRLDGDIVARAGVNRYTASAAVTRAEDRGVETARNWTTAFKYDRFVSTRMFLNANAILTNDRFRDLDLRTALGAGVGYQVLTTPRVTLTADGGLGYVNENLESQPDDSYTALRESVSLDAFAVPGSHPVLPRARRLLRRHRRRQPVHQDAERHPHGLAAGFVTTLRHDLDYDRSPAVGRRNTDRTFALTLGYRF